MIDHAGWVYRQVSLDAVFRTWSNAENMAEVKRWEMLLAYGVALTVLLVFLRVKILNRKQWSFAPWTLSFATGSLYELRTHPQFIFVQCHQALVFCIPLRS